MAVHAHSARLISQFHLYDRVSVPSMMDNYYRVLLYSINWLTGLEIERVIYQKQSKTQVSLLNRLLTRDLIVKTTEI